MQSSLGIVGLSEMMPIRAVIVGLFETTPIRAVIVGLSETTPIRAVIVGLFETMPTRAVIAGPSGNTNSIHVNKPQSGALGFSRFTQNYSSA